MYSSEFEAGEQHLSEIDEELEAELAKLGAISEDEIRRVQEELIASDGLDFTRRWDSLSAVGELEESSGTDVDSSPRRGREADAAQSEARKALDQLHLLLSDDPSAQDSHSDWPSHTPAEDSSSQVYESSSENASEAWKAFHQRRRDRDNKLEEYGRSMEEGKVLASQVKASAGLLVQSLASNELTSEVLKQADAAAAETDGDRKAKYLREMQEMQAMQRQAEEERRRKKEEEWQARERAREEAERMRLQREAEMREDRERAEREMEAHRRNLEMAMRASEEKIMRERQRAEEELKRAIEMQKQEEQILVSMKNARLEMKKKEEEIEMNRSRRSTDWHKELVKKQEEVRIETQRKAAHEKKQDEQLRAGSASVLEAASRRAIFASAHQLTVSASKLVTACARRQLDRRDFQLALQQLEASRIAQELQHSERDAQETWRTRRAHAPFRTVKDAVITRWSMQRRRMRRSKQTEEEEEDARNAELSCSRPCWTLQTELKRDMDSLNQLRGAKHESWVQRDSKKPEEEGGEEWGGEEDLASTSHGQDEMSGPSDFLSALDMQYGSVDYKRVTKIELNVEELKSVEGIQLCSSLTSLSVNVNHLSSLEPLRGLSSLRHLQVRENQLSSLSCLQDLHQLVSLRADVNRIADMKGLAPLSALRTLELQNNNISLVSPNDLLGCSSLEKLVLYRNQISAVQGLNSMSQLLHLNLGRNNLSAVEGLEGCRRLEVLIMYENKILSFPDSFSSMFLREIWLNGNQISSLPSFPFLPFLQSLHLGDNQISRLPPLYGIGASLSLLDLSFNRVAHVHNLLSLLPCPSLARVRFNDNPVAELPDYLPLLFLCLPYLQEVDHHPVALADQQQHAMCLLRGDASVLLHLRRHGMFGLHFKASMETLVCRQGDAVWVDHRAILNSKLRRESEMMEVSWHENEQEGGAKEGSMQKVLLKRNNLIALKLYLISLRERLFQKQRREERAMEDSIRSSKLNLCYHSGRELDWQRQVHSHQVYQLQDRQVKQLRDKAHLTHSGTFTRSKVYERRMKDASDLQRSLAAAQLQAATRRASALSCHRHGREAQEAASVMQAHARTSLCMSAMAEMRTSLRVLSVAMKRAVMRMRFLAAINLRHDDLEDDWMLQEDEEENFWRSAPTDLDALMAPDLNSTRLEDVGNIQELRLGERGEGGWASQGTQEESEEVKRKIAELSQLVKDKRSQGASRRELQPVVDELLHYKELWSQLEKAPAQRPGAGAGAGAGSSFGNLPPINQERVGTFEIQDTQLTMLDGHLEEEERRDGRRGGEEEEEEAAAGDVEKSPSKKSKSKDHSAVMEEEYRVTNKKAEEIAAEWGFSNVKSAELMLRKRMKYQKLAREKEKRETLLDPEHRLARFKRVIASSNTAHSSSLKRQERRGDDEALPMVPVHEATLASPQPSPTRPASHDAIPARPHQRHVRSRIAQVPRASLASLQFDTSRSSDGINQLMEFQTEQLNNKLVRGARLNNTAARSGSSGSSGSSKKSEPHRSIPQLRVNNFFL